MAARVMVVWILVLQVFWAGVYVLFSRHFDGANIERQRVAILERKLHQNTRTMARLELDFNEYKDAIVAAGVKINDKTEWTDPKRMIASVMADPDFKQVPGLIPGTTEFQKAKKLFAAGDMKRSQELLDDFVQNYPDSPSLPEATYLLGEADFSEDQLEDSVKNIDSLVTHFPETEYAAYGLVRLGKIFEKQDRLDEAAEIYDVVINNYPKSGAAAIAAKDKKGLGDMIPVLQRSAMIFTRVFLVSFCFTADIKVRADVLFQSAQGRVEAEKNGLTLGIAPNMQMIEPFDLQTFNDGTAKFEINTIFLGVGSRSLISVSREPNFNFNWGQIFISVPPKEVKWVSIHTPQCDLTTAGGEFLVEVRDGKTFVTTVGGALDIDDRSAKKTVPLRAGYADWVGGLLASGEHAKGVRPTALDFDPTMAWLKTLSNFSPAEWQNRYDNLKPLWRKAVDEVAQETQDQVLGDLQALGEIQEAEKKREARHMKEQAQLRAQFRRRMLEGPDENTEGPSESARVPASSGE